MIKMESLIGRNGIKMKKIIDKGQPNGEPWTDKDTYHSYFPIYEAEFDKLKDIDLLEIGVFKGGSMIVWDDHFEGNNTILGIDDFAYVNKDEVWVDLNRVFEGNSTNPIGWDEKLNNLTFDYIIDDGDHTSGAQIKTIEVFFKYLKKGGKYFIEDIMSDNDLNSLEFYLKSNKYSYKVYDVRSQKNRWDDLMIVVYN